MGPAAVERLAGLVAPHAPSFDARRFVGEVSADLAPLELMERVERVTRGLHDTLGLAYPKALPVLVAALPADDGSHFGEGDVSGFMLLPLLRYVSTYGLEHPERSLDALGEMTRRFSAEFDVRPFLRRWPDLAWTYVDAWSRSADARQRRLSSEGTRPRLPWATRLDELVRDPTRGLAVLERLRADPDEVVRRSVANHLNDVAKDHPGRVVDTARRWLAAEASEDTRRLVRHALRSLVKQGHPDALDVLGFHREAPLALVRLRVDTPVVQLGDALTFTLTVRSESAAPATLSIDYAIHHRKADGTLAPKVFKLARRTLGPGESLTIERTHAMRPITTRRYYPGAHRLELLVNGRSLGVRAFRLRV